MQKSITILKNPKLGKSSDYNFLRAKGLEYIQQLGSKLWTDYNEHDPGITILEALCYAITDLGYRTSLNIKDLMADKPDVPPANRYDFNKQAFFTAREILTVNACTINDYRKLLIDIDGIKNGWLNCRACPCNDVFLYANCTESILQYQYTAPDKQVIIKGMYDVLIEFEDEERTGNLNSGKIWYNFSFLSGENYTTAAIEMRMPSWFAVEENKEKYRDIRAKEIKIKSITVDFVSANKLDDADIPDLPAVLLDNALKGPLYASLTVLYNNPGDLTDYPLVFIDVPVTVWFRSSADRKNITLDDIKAAIKDETASGIVSKYIQKIKEADTVIAMAEDELNSHRNLCEDYCSVKAIEVQDIAICADMEVKPGADIEAVLAEAYYLIDQYFSPDIKFYSLKELLDAGKPVDEIFEGPQLSNGFIDNDQLQQTNLKKVLYTSDIINLLMNIEGVVSVRDFVLVKYDADGNVAKIVNKYNKLVPDIQSWSMDVGTNLQPRLYVKASKMLVFKNGLPFLPDNAEFLDTLQVIKANNSQPKYTVAENNIPVPLGDWYELDSYYPVQYSLPVTYGVGYEGVPDSASTMRKAQAKQLKAYLLFFEQMLADYFRQLSHIKELFAVDKTIGETYFSNVIGEAEIKDISAIYNGVTETQLNAAVRNLVETDTVRLDRRNRFLDHLLARFSEQFTDYALMLYSYTNDKAIADEQLIDNKIDFIENFPFLSANRGRALNYKDETKVCNSENIAGLHRRIELLLGLNKFGFMNYFELYEEKDKDGKFVEYRWRLTDSEGNIYVSSSKKHIESSLAEFAEKAKKDIAEVYRNFTVPERYLFKKDKNWTVIVLLNEAGEVIARRMQKFKTLKEAKAVRDTIIEYAKEITAAEKLFVVEHLLLRPRFTKGQPFLFEIYEEKDKDGVVYERRWRMIDEQRKIYLSSSTRYFDTDISLAWEKAKAEITLVCEALGNKDNYTINHVHTWHLDLVHEGEVIATRIEKFDTQEEAEYERDKIIKMSAFLVWDNADAGTLMINAGAENLLFGRDPLLPVCLSGDCSLCAETDPYSFRFTVVVNGEDGMANNDIEFRRFAENTIRLETPAHLAVKICWVSKKQLLFFADVYCAWRTEIAKKEPNALSLHQKLTDLLKVFGKLKNVYPPATLHDCIDGNDENRVYLNNTII